MPTQSRCRRGKSSAMSGLVGRSFLALTLCLTMAGTLWGVSLMAGPGEGPTKPLGTAARLDAPVPQVAQLRLDTTAAQAVAVPPGQQQPQGPPKPDPLGLWAGQTA